MSEAASVFSDGGCILKNPSDIGGSWAACHVDADGERVWSDRGLILAVPGDDLLSTVSNNQSEFMALLRGLEALPDDWGGTVYSDSLVTLRRFEHWETAGLAGIPLDWRRRLAIARGRLGLLRFVLLDGHPSKAQLAAGVGKRGNPVSEWNVWCDRACTEVGRQYLGVESKPKRERKAVAV